MRENRTSGSVRGALGNGRSYRESHALPPPPLRLAPIGVPGWVLERRTLEDGFRGGIL